ncbi:MAG: MMPL family transporter, partial [Acidobacteriota bacterium]
MFLAIEEFSRRRYILVFVLIAVVMAGSALLGSRIHLDTDILALVPQGDRAVDAFKESLRSFGAADYIAVMIEAPEERRAMDFSEFADRFVERVSEIDGVESVEDRLNPGSEMLSLFRKYALLFLPPDELPKLREKLSDEAIREQVRRDRRILLNPASPLTKELVRNDPLGLGPLVWKHLVKAQAALQFKTGEEGYYLSKDGSALLVLIKPTLPAQDLGFAERLVGDLHEAEARTREELAGDLGGLQDVSVSYAGTYIVGLDDSNLIKSDMKLTALVSFVGILALYYIGYRRFGALVYSSAPLIVGQAMTFAVAYLVFGTLNSASSGFVAMVMGLGTDFTIVMYARYVEERLRGESLAEASRKMMGEGGLGMFTGAITSAGTFYAMCVTRFRGLWEMGFLIGTGILLSMVAIVFMLPAMIQWNEGSRRRKELMKRLHVQSFGFEHLIPLAVRRPAVTLAALAIVTAFAGFAAWNIGFSDDIADLRSPENKGN